MSRIYPRLSRLFLAVALVIGGMVAHLDSAVHTATGEFGDTHEHMTPAETKAPQLSAQLGHAEVSKSETDSDDPSHAPELCLEAHCCTPGVQLAAQDVLRHPYASKKLVVTSSSDYALSLAYSLLRPPRAIA